MDPKVSVGIVFSDGVIREHGTGKLTLIGIFQILNAPAFPFQCFPFQVTVFLHYLPIGEAIEVRISVETVEGQKLAEAKGQLKIDNVVEPEGQIELPLAMPQILFQAPGVYPVKVFVNDKKVGEKPIFLRSIVQLQFRNN